MGLYVIDEANIESHGMGFAESTLACHTGFQDAHMQRVCRMCERDKNHAAIIVWSLGNEAGNGPAFHRTYEWLKRHEPTRPVQYENARVEPGWSSNEVETIDTNTDLCVGRCARNGLTRPFHSNLVKCSHLSYRPRHVRQVRPHVSVALQARAVCLSIRARPKSTPTDHVRVLSRHGKFVWRLA